MSIITINGVPTDVDIREELELFEWDRPTWHADRLTAASPFRDDRTPSFYVYYEDTSTAKAGYFGDSGTGERGGFIKLLAFLREETEEETALYLTETYGTSEGEERLKLRIPRLKIVEPRRPLAESLLTDVKIGPNAYLTNRGISEDVQREAGVGLIGKTAVIPWRLPNKRLANVKYRSTRNKAFWYAKGGLPIRELIYGIETVYADRAKTAVLAEAEIDALSWRTAGYCGIATGGSKFSAEKADIIAQSSIEYLIVITDNDEAGKKLRKEVELKMRGKVRLAHGYITEGYKDANELLMAKGEGALKRVVSRAEAVSINVRFGNIRTFGRRRLS
ncbi:DNA primase [Bacillus pumilus]|uniref:toprim domain-containing protein n=1 Tax=Bacillus pumilus TaxID=1408 RepID=UPI00017A5FC9|nr:toprim domain-containing protein [Bacillus pumilus]EDW22738.1 DNA primase [Bacillus pumilus ATCC 7061]MCR4352209.1 toprim domain-containing protein [Bacillus pumilus]MCY7504020.1 toprim domain-containing protein [Bacillus pumilus]MDR4268990.1 DNA primase [Bacillus pumilus]MDR4269077.1 DNA primase [Bacillus pumilus]